ncbi:hypothetical protein GH984_01665 [Spiribacter sp. C176]|uniref:Uncharacterized protein n=1 Tax=Spiribacter salilacus TaxID=2664894 RepID=A0A6N7QSY1_9GAMM|nr:hypothetical protein [Spiribacter salilacus]
MSDNGQMEVTTDSWSWKKILKHVILPKPKGSPKAGQKEIALRISLAAVGLLLALLVYFK